MIETIHFCLIQRADDTEAELYGRISNLENELEAVRHTMNKMESKEKEDNRNLIRTNRELKASSNKVKAFQEKIATLQNELSQRDSMTLDLGQCCILF